MARYPVVQTPERPRGTPEQKIDMLYRTLWQLVEELNNIINTMNREGTSNEPERKG